MQAAMNEPAPGLEELDVGQLDALQNDTESWELPRIADEMGVSRITVDSWRHRSLKYIRKDVAIPTLPNVLPEPDMTYSRVPIWTAGRIRTWAMQTGRMLPDGTPVRSKPPGRPRKRAG